jgi:hypothetical protein
VLDKGWALYTGFLIYGFCCSVVAGGHHHQSFLCVCGLFISELSSPMQICVFGMIRSCALTRVRVFIAHTNELRPHRICFQYYPLTHRLVVDNTYQVTKITLIQNFRQVPTTPRQFFMEILADFLIGAEDMITVYTFCEPGNLLNMSLRRTIIFSSHWSIADERPSYCKQHVLHKGWYQRALLKRNESFLC